LAGFEASTEVERLGQRLKEARIGAALVFRKLGHAKVTELCESPRISFKGVRHI